MADPLDFVDGLISLADVSKPEFVAEMKALPRVFANAAAVRTYDLSTRTRIMVGDDFYKLDTESVEEDDGDSVIIDAGGNHWVKIANGGSDSAKLNRDGSNEMTGPFLMGQQEETPANPASGKNKLYFKPDGKLYKLDSDGNEVEVANGGGASGERVQRFETISDLQTMSSTDFVNGEAVSVEASAVANDGGGGIYRYRSADMSSVFVRSTTSVLTGDINASTDTISKTAHGLRTGQGGIVTAGDGLTANTVVYYVRATSANAFTLHPTYVDAIENTNKVDITGMTAFYLKVLADPDQVAYVTLTGKALDGSEGGFLNSDAFKRNQWHVEWFPGSGSDDTDQINRAILAAGTGGDLRFPIDTLVFSKRDDDDDTCLWQLSGQRWHGVDRQQSILQLSSAVTDIKYGIRQVEGAENCVMVDLCIDGNRANITPGVDLYSNFNLIVGPDGGAHNRFRRLLIKNSWGRSLQTGLEGGGTNSEDILVEDVTVLNAGTKAISATFCTGVRIKDCYVEVDPYAAADHPGGADADSGSCYESNRSFEVIFEGNKGKQIGASIAAPGIRIINGGGRNKATRNYIEDASYLAFIQNNDDVEFSHNTGLNIRGNAILIADSDDLQPSDTTRRIRVFGNTIIDPDDAYVLIVGSKSTGNPWVECFIYDNDFVQISGSPTYGIYNSGIVSPATVGTVDVFQWNNRFTGTIPNQIAGTAVDQIQPRPESGWQIVAQSNVAVSYTGGTSEQTLATIAILPHYLGKNGRLRVTAVWSCTVNANTKTTRFRFGGSQAHSSGPGSTIAQTRNQIEIGNRNSLSSQIVQVPGVASGFGATASSVLTMSIDTSSSKNLTITGQLGTGTDTITLESYVVEVFHQN